MSLLAQDGNGTRNVFDRLAMLYMAQQPHGYDLARCVETFYKDAAFWEKFRQWEQTPESYSRRDKQFVESTMRVDGASVVNIGCFYPWAELEWGRRAAGWLALDGNATVIERARSVVVGQPCPGAVSFVCADITVPMRVPSRFDHVLDLSTFDQLDPRRYAVILQNYAALADSLVMAYDATEQPLAVFDFGQYGFDAHINPDALARMLELTGFRLVADKPFAYETRSYVHAVRVSPPAREQAGAPATQCQS